MLQDIRFGFRLLSRHPGFSVAAILTLALGIGVNTAIFAVAWQAILKPLPYPDADRLVHVWETSLPSDSINSVTPANFHDWVREHRSFDAIAAYTYLRGTADLTGAGDPEQWQIRHVTGDYFRVFGMPALAGRTIEPADVRPDSRAVVLSEGVWRRRFGGGDEIVGREIRLGGRLHVVVGVMPAAFETAAGRVDAWAPLPIPATPPRLSAHYLGVVARLRPDVTVAQATADVKAIAARAAEKFPVENGKLSATVRSLQEERGPTVRAGLGVLTWAAGGVLLIACANLASLQLARGLARRRELGIRTALGASRRRLVVQLVTEGLILSGIGTLAGLMLNGWLLQGLRLIGPAPVQAAAAMGVDRVVVLYAAGLALTAALLFTLMPAWHAATEARGWLRQRSDTGDRVMRRARTLLVAGQIALAVALVVGATLLVVSLARLLRVDPGFDPSGVIAFDLSVPAGRYGTFAQRLALFDHLDEELRAIPGVTATCAINEIPFDAQGTMTYVPQGQDAPVNAAPRTITPGCFETLRLRLGGGRLFTAQETSRVAVVSETFARAAWPAAEAVGQRIHVGTRDGALVEVVGVVADAQQVSLDRRSGAQVYERASGSTPFQPNRMLVRTSGDPAAMMSPVRSAVRRADPGQPVARLRTLDDIVAASWSGRRFDLALVASFSGIALGLAAVGIYGLLAQVVAQRRREIGIRLALGATAGSAVQLVMRSAWTAVSVGIPLGLGSAFLGSRLVEPFMFAVSGSDVRIYAGAAAALTLVSLASAWLAARRAASVDPASALR